MKISKVVIKKTNARFWDGILSILSLPVIIIIFFLVLLMSVFWLLKWIIKEKILGIKEENKIEQREDILFQNKHFKIVRNFISVESETEENAPFLGFCYSIDEQEEEPWLFQLRDLKNATELEGCYVTDFIMETNLHLYLQQLTKKDTEVKSHLIAFDIHSGKVKIIHEVGNFLLKKFAPKTMRIKGFGKNQSIQLQVEGITLLK